MNFNIGIPICQNVIFIVEVTFWRICMFSVEWYVIELKTIPIGEIQR